MRKRMDKKDKEDTKNRRRYIVCLILLIIILIGLCSFFIIKIIKYKTPIDNNTKITDFLIEDDNIWDGKMNYDNIQDNEDNKISIPGYKKIIVDNNNPNIKLVNPSDNDVYFVYTITNIETEKVIYKTNAIKPGNMIELNIKNILDAGEYSLSFQIDTYDYETQVACNGAVQKVSLYIK